MGLYYFRSLSQRYYTTFGKTLTDTSGDFHFDYDIEQDSTATFGWPGAIVGLFQSSHTDNTSAGADQNNTGLVYGVAVESRKYSTTANLFVNTFTVRLDDGSFISTSNIVTDPGDFNMSIDYDATLRAFTFTVTDNSTSIVVDTTILALEDDEHFNADQFGVGNQNIKANNNGSYVAVAVDNMLLTAVPEPATMGLLGIGLLVMSVCRRSH